MICYAVQNNQMLAGGISSESSDCVATPVNFIGDCKMKTCSKCREIKTLSEFYKDRSRKDGLFGYCKSCKKSYQQQYQQASNGKAAHLKRQVKYLKTPKGKALAAKYQKSPKGKAAHRKGTAKFNARHPNYAKATNAVNNAIRAGRLPRAASLPCYYCPKPAQQYHHWRGYEPEHWLDVVQVCIKCHLKIHKKTV